MLYLKKNKLCHRDLKPENIFLDNDVIKIGDFGTAKDIKNTYTNATYIGTHVYMSPEILNIDPDD